MGLPKMVEKPAKNRSIASAPFSEFDKALGQRYLEGEIEDAIKELGPDYEEFEVRLVRLKFLCEVAN